MKKINKEIIEEKVNEINKQYEYFFSCAAKGDKKIFYFDIKQSKVKYWIETGHIENQYKENKNNIILGEVAHLCNNTECEDICYFNPHVQITKHSLDKHNFKGCCNFFQRMKIYRELEENIEKHKIKWIEKNEIELISYIQSSKYRKKVLLSLKEKVKTPTNIAKDSGIRTNHISKVLSELKEEKLIECLNEEMKRGRLYRITPLGYSIIDKF